MDIDDIVRLSNAFIDAQWEAEKEDKHEFICPLCGGDAWWDRAEVNNHLHSGCRKCGHLVIE